MQRNILCILGINTEVTSHQVDILHLHFIHTISIWIFFNLNTSVNNLEITERTIHKGLQYVFKQWRDVNEQDI